MQKKTKSILDELFMKESDFSLSVFESRSDHVLNSVINLFEMVSTLPLSEKEQQNIEKRILLSIKNRDSEKFNKYISQLRKKHERI